MGKKYIIELLDKCNSKFKGIMLFGLTQEEQISVELMPEESMTPYTEPDIEQVRKEAYDKGYHNGHSACYETAKDIMEEKKNEAYQRGLADAWETARKIVTMPDRDFINSDILDLDPGESIFTKYTASEAIAKIKEYEDGKQEIKVGDEVERILNGEVDSKAVFLGDDDGYFRCLFWTGSCFTTLCYPKKQFRKTGRHFPEIAAVLEKMRGEQE